MRGLFSFLPPFRTDTQGTGGRPAPRRRQAAQQPAAGPQSIFEPIESLEDRCLLSAVGDIASPMVPWIQPAASTATTTGTTGTGSSSGTGTSGSGSGSTGTGSTGTGSTGSGGTGSTGTGSTGTGTGSSSGSGSTSSTQGDVTGTYTGTLKLRKADASGN